MKWYTHAAVGANAVWLTAAVGRVDEYAALLAAAGGLAALLPDIDAVAAKVHFLGGGALGMFRARRRGIFEHRGIWHSIFAIVVVFGASLFFFSDVHPALPYILALGYGSHLLIDSLNTSVGFLYPFYNRRINIMPRPLRSKVGGPVDTVLFLVACMALVVFLLGNVNSFFPVDWTE